MENQEELESCSCKCHFGGAESCPECIKNHREAIHCEHCMKN